MADRATACPNPRSRLHRTSGPAGWVHTFNISDTTAFVVAGRASRSPSTAPAPFERRRKADVARALGSDITLSQAGACQEAVVGSERRESHIVFADARPVLIRTTCRNRRGPNRLQIISG